MSTSDSFAFWSFSQDFLSAAKAVKDNNTLESPLVAYYLVGHSIELSLKSYPAAKEDYNSKTLRSDYGHNLGALLDEATRRKLGREVKLSKQQKKAIKSLSTPYRSKKFEYLEYGNYRLPKYSCIYETAEILLNRLAHYASNSPFNKKALKRTSR